MAGTLRDTVRELLKESRLTKTIIAEESGVPYGALNHFATKGEDMRSEYMENLYIYFTGKPVVEDHED